MYLNFIDLVILISASQCLFLSIIIFIKYGSTRANKALALLLFFYALVLSEMLLTDIGLFQTNPRIMLLLIGTPFLVGPLHYLYARYLTHFSDRFRIKDLFHFVPFFLYLIAILPEMIKSPNQLMADFSSPEVNAIPLPFLILNWLVMIQVIVYALLTISVVRKYSRHIKDIFSSIEKIKLDWLTYVMLLFSSVVILYIIENMLVTGGIITSQYPVSSIVAGLYVYVLGYLVLFKSEVFASPEFTMQIEQIKDLEPEPENESKKYVKSGLNEDAAEEYLKTLIKIMDETKPYLDCELTLNKLADLIHASPHNLSEVINRKMNQNFFDFVNKYRVEKVKRDMLNPKMQNYTLLSIAQDAGFKSKSSFNTVFKKQTGLTPSEYRKRNSKQG